MQMVHCERCRFNFETEAPRASCPQCGNEAVPAEQADRGRENAPTQELQIFDVTASGNKPE